ncbi:hypothetical protein ALC57_02312, partial [Trachymyrmex cornetzi]
GPVGPGGPYGPGPMYSVLGKLALYGPTGPEAAPVGNGEGGIPLNNVSSLSSAASKSYRARTFLPSWEAFDAPATEFILGYKLRLASYAMKCFEYELYFLVTKVVWL